MRKVPILDVIRRKTYLHIDLCRFNYVQTRLITVGMDNHTEDILCILANETCTKQNKRKGLFQFGICTDTLYIS